MAVFLTLNTFLHEVRLFGVIPVWQTAPAISARLDALPAALAETGADVISLQEVYRRPHRDRLVQALKESHPWSVGLKQPGLPLGTGLLILSRHPVRNVSFHEFRAAVFEERIAVRSGLLACTIDFPDLGETRVVNTHLSAGGLKHHPESEAATTLRRHQIGELLDVCNQVAPGPVVIAGDLNSGPHTSSENYHQILEADFHDGFDTADGSGRTVTWDPKNPVIAGERNRKLPPQRIDHVLFKGEGLAATAAEVVLHEARTADGLPVSDHYGLLARIETA